MHGSIYSRLTSSLHGIGAGAIGSRYCQSQPMRRGRGLAMLCVRHTGASEGTLIASGLLGGNQRSGALGLVCAKPLHRASITRLLFRFKKGFTITLRLRLLCGTALYTNLCTEYGTRRLSIVKGGPKTTLMETKYIFRGQGPLSEVFSGCWGYLWLQKKKTKKHRRTQTHYIDISTTLGRSPS